MMMGYIINITNIYSVVELGDINAIVNGIYIFETIFGPATTKVK